MSLQPLARLAFRLAAAALGLVAADRTLVAQIALEDSQTITAEAGPSFLRTGDLDGDAIPDLLAFGKTDGKALIYRGRGDGTFEAARIVRADRRGSRFVDATLADIHGDGRLDLITLQANWGDVTVWPGNGDFSFGTAIRVPVTASPSQVLAVDADRNGALDLVVVDPAVAVLLRGNGAGGFGPMEPVAIDNGGPVDRASLADFDDDGLVDVAIAAERIDPAAPPLRTDADLFVTRGDGRGAFLSPMRHVIDAGLGYPRTLESTDANGDGRIDVLVTGYATRTGSSDSWPSPVALLGDGARGVAARVRLLESARIVPLGVGDLDGDGIDDIVAVDWENANDSSIRVFQSATGDGVLGETYSKVISGGSSSFAVAVADWDSDGYRETALLADVGYWAQVRTTLNRATGLCRAGTVNAGRGPVTDVLFVDSPSRSAGRRALLRQNEPFRIEMAAPPAATGPSPFALFSWRGEPTPGSATALPFGIGSLGMPHPAFGPGGAPGAIFNNTGRARLGNPTAPSTPAPSRVLDFPLGLGRGARFYLQGIVADPGSAGSRRASVTNGVLVIVR